MKRLHLIEIGDQVWLPTSVRDALTDYLQFVINLTQPYAPIVPQLRRALQRTNTRRIVDLCSGGAGPWLSLRPALEESGSISVLLTDKFPNLQAFQRAESVARGVLEFVAEPVDATDAPDEMIGFRTLFSSFHHFRPAEARRILGDAVRKRQGIGIFEATHRSALAILLMFVTPLLTLVFTPFIRPFRWSRLLWTYAVPVIPLVVLFDSIVSCLRTYTPAELQVLTADLSPETQYQWEIGEQRTGRAPLPITYLIGYPIKAGDAEGTAPPLHNLEG